jgi:hypothetical protein
MYSFWKQNPVEQAVMQECVEGSSAIVGQRGAIIISSLSLGPQIWHFAFSLSLPLVTEILTISIATSAYL